MTKKTQFNIIIAEDDMDDTEVILDVFERNPKFNQIILVSNGEELLSYLNNPSNLIPDVILTDINMPIMNGIEALQQISEINSLKDIPCFVYSTGLNPIYQQKCDFLGVKACLIKPYTIKEFEQIPESIVRFLEK
ncbi:response regulator [Flavobacterium sp. 3-218]